MYIIIFIDKIWIVSIINIQQIDKCFIVIVSLGQIVTFEITFIMDDKFPGFGEIYKLK
jgi:hypothetical protein